MLKSAESFHRAHLSKYQQKLNIVTTRSRRFAWYRLFTFIIIFLPFIVWGWNGWQTVIPMTATMALFFFLVKKNITFDKKKKKYGVLVKLSADELLALDNRFSHFDNGEDYLDPAHFNSYDLDLFGEGSIFQFLNRTCTLSGRHKLAQWLQHPPLIKQEIERRQEAVEELSKKPDWMMQFLAQGHLFTETAGQNEEIKSWSEKELHLEGKHLIKWLLIPLPLVTIAAGIFALSGGSNFWVILLAIMQGALLYYFRKLVSLYYSNFGRKAGLLEMYMHLIRLIETEEFNSPYLKDLQKTVVKPETAGNIVEQLKQIINRFEYRNNVIINFLFNAFLLWDIRCTYQLWKWHSRNRKKLTGWIECIALTDGLISLANMALNNPAFCYPKIHEGGFVTEAKKMGHPLLSASQRINNDFRITGWGKAVIITGANMAGKSTFLRTVGVNLILARTGAPVCAGELTFTPVKIYTNMRTTDSLLKNESYFFAELKRIKYVLNKLTDGERIFVILDEMLKGTNSVDKLNGSKLLIKKLLELKAVALIATHDLKLSELEDEYPQMVFNKSFDIKIENDEMVFDYLLKEGVTKTMNATFLMKKMGII